MAYSGAYGSGTRQPEPSGQEPPRAEEKTVPPARGPERRSGPDLSGILKSIEAAGLETDDLLMALILFLLYRESGDTDMLILLGVMLLT